MSIRFFWDLDCYLPIVPILFVFFKGFFRQTLWSLMNLVLLLFLLYNTLFFIPIARRKYLHLSSAGSCIGKSWPCIYAHCACFFEIVKNFLLRLRINTSWFRIKSLCYPESCFLFFEPIYCILATYLLVFIFPLHLIHIEYIEAVSCWLSSLDAH
jgi:hypothetical protein